MKLLLREDAKRQLWRNEIEQQQLELHSMMKAIGTHLGLDMDTIASASSKKRELSKLQRLKRLRSRSVIGTPGIDAQVPKTPPKFGGVPQKQRNSRNLHPRQSKKQSRRSSVSGIGDIADEIMSTRSRFGSNLTDIADTEYDSEDA